VTSNTPIVCVACSISPHSDAYMQISVSICALNIHLQDDKVSENRTQRFREVPGKLEAALSHFAETGCDAVIHLGDIIQSESDSKEQTLEEFESIERIFASHVVRSNADYCPSLSADSFCCLAMTEPEEMIRFSVLCRARFQ